MKLITVMILALLSFSLFASVDELVGKYATKDKKGAAVITKVLLAQPTLFEPARFEYRISLQLEGKQSLWLENETLELGANGKFLHVNLEIECDDPGCVYFNSVDVAVAKKANGKVELSVEYDGFKYEDDDQAGYEFNGKALFLKK